MLASGLRSSCAASATNERCRSRPAASRSSIPFRVMARARISSAAGGTGSRLHRRGSARRANRPGALICSAPARSSSTGRSVQPITRQAITARSGQQHREGDQQARCAGPSGWPGRRRSGTAAITLTGSRRGPAATASTRSGSPMPSRTPATTNASPASAWLELVGPQQRGQPVRGRSSRRPPAARRRRPGSPGRPETGTGSGSRFSLTMAATSLGAGQRLVVQGPVERQGQRAVERQTAHDQRQRPPRSAR